MNSSKIVKKVKIHCKHHKHRILKYKEEGPRLVAAYLKNWNSIKTAHMYLKTDISLVEGGLNYAWAKHLILHDVKWNICEVKRISLATQMDLDTLTVLREMENLLIRDGAKFDGVESKEFLIGNSCNLEVGMRPIFETPLVQHTTETEFLKLGSILTILLDSRIKHINWIAERRKRFMIFMITIMAATHLFSDFSDVDSIISFLL